MTADTKRTLTPRLRFPEFRDGAEWEKTPLGILGTFMRGLTYSADDVDEGGLLVLRSSNIQDGRLVLDFDLVHVRKQCPPELLLREGDIAICMSNGSKALVGKSAEYKGGHPGPLTVGAFCSIFRTSTTFAKIAFTTRHYEDFVALGIAGGNINNLKNSDLETFEFAVPRDEDERQKIAVCLESLDELVAGHVQKLETLRAYKKGLMQQLFPPEDETVPRLRFPEFRASKWQRRQIGEMLQETSRPIVMEDEQEYSLVTVKRRYGGVVARERLDGRSILVKSQFTVKTNDFLISNRQIVHNACGLVPEELDSSIVSNEYSVLTPKDGCDIRFFNYFAQQPCVSNSFLQSSVGIVIEKMLFKLDWWLKLEFLFPSPEEQRRIADCIQSLERQISAQTRKLIALKIHKKGHMQQLLPSSEGIES